ncbi:hypothetical protein MS3_00008683 [Schistosoma haematobium]|uniref:Uncharacterized protein n=1 Tax=Schistosoma haematobium TaxID=6185 RepID=A0A922IKW9_SCHHA|nr:hypothetical protein MS3_00008683 [Schistosoma haematobium]KAH9581583.1 hypothetical protein MS3_00008683 [Schistosoma haematobium]
MLEDSKAICSWMMNYYWIWNSVKFFQLNCFLVILFDLFLLQQISNKLIVEHVNKICKENEELYKDILNKSELIKAMEAEKSNLEKQNEEVRHNQVFSKDLEYVEYKRCEGLSQLKSLSPQK